jgi:hypothetical protein
MPHMPDQNPSRDGCDEVFRELALADVRLAVEELRASRSAAAATNVAVFLDLNTEQVTRVLIQRPGL